jgi:hypothetical protein
MAYEGLFPLMLAPQRQQSQLVTLMIPSMVPGLSQSARSVASGVTALTAVTDAENQKVVAVTQAVEATAQVSTRPAKTLSDADLTSRPQLAAAVQASPNLRAHIDATAVQIGNHTQALIDQVDMRTKTALDQTVDALKTVAPAGKFAGTDLEQFAEVARAIVERNATGDILKAADVAAFETKFKAKAP